MGELESINEYVGFDLSKTGNVNKVEVIPILDSGVAISASGSTGNFISKGYYDFDSFDVPYPGGNDDWELRDSIDPVITSSTFYNGGSSLYMSFGGGRNFEDSNGLEQGQTNSGYSSDSYPYMCMAYKIPAATKNNMLLHINGDWYSITMTSCVSSDPTIYSKVATWNPLIADDEWHYKCINLDEQLDVSMGTGNHQITGVIWHSPGGCDGISGEFWIDDFLISE